MTRGVRLRGKDFLRSSFSSSAPELQASTLSSSGFRVGTIFNALGVRLPLTVLVGDVRPSRTGNPREFDGVGG